jgi:hypothetical protein
MKQQTNRVRLTAGRVDEFACPADKPQAFLWDTDTPTLALRVTPTGRKTYVFESRLDGATIRINLGTVADWPIEKARTKAQGLKMLVLDGGQDPREIERQQQADKAASQGRRPWVMCGPCTLSKAAPSARKHGSPATLPT